MKLMTVMVSGCLAIGAASLAQAAGGANRPVSRNAPSAAQLLASAPMPATERRALTRQIESRWSSYVRKVHNIDPAVWSRSMAPIFASAEASNLRNAAARTTYEGMVATLLGQQVSDATIIDAMAKSDSPLVIQAFGSPANDLVYTMVTPCRIVDTRVVGAGGPLTADSTRSFKASAVGTTFAALGQGGDASDCGIPAGPSAVVLDVVAVRPGGDGYLTVFPYGVTRPLAASLNYTTGSLIANEIIAKQTIGQAYGFSVYSPQQTNLVIDIVGYFMAPQQAALIPSSVPHDVIIPNGQEGFVSYLPCAAGSTQTGGYCYYGADGTPGIYLLETGNLGCVFRNNSGADITGSSITQCARTPGR